MERNRDRADRFLGLLGHVGLAFRLGENAWQRQILPDRCAVAKSNNSSRVPEVK
jgi:hypothetical protein